MHPRKKRTHWLFRLLYVELDDERRLKLVAVVARMMLMTWVWIVNDSVYVHSLGGSYIWLSGESRMHTDKRVLVGPPTFLRNTGKSEAVPHSEFTANRTLTQSYVPSVTFIH